MPWRKYISAPYLKWLFWIVVLLLWANVFIVARYNGVLRWQVISQETIQLTWGLLMFTLFLTLFRKLFPICSTLVRILPLRKNSGILAFFILGLYVVAELLKNGLYKDWSAFFSSAVFPDSPLTFGTLFFALFYPFFLILTEWAVKKISANTWFRLHQLAHILFVVMSLYVLWSIDTLKTQTLFGLALYLLGYLSLFLKRVLIHSQKYNMEDVLLPH